MARILFSRFQTPSCFGRLLDARSFEEGNCKFNSSIKKADELLYENVSLLS